MTMTNERRLEIELRILNKYMAAMKDAGWTIDKVDYGDGWEDDDGRRISDEERILFTHPDNPKKQWLFFVYGNHPSEVLCDYTVGLEDVVAPVNDYAETWADR